MSDAITIRDARPDDWQTICSYNLALALESEGLQLQADTVAAGVRALLNDPGKGRYFISEIDGQLAGQTMVTLEWSDWRNGWFYWIQSVYVLPRFRRRGVFRGLLTHVRGLARESGDVVGLRLYVDRENTTAIDTYHAAGMADTGYRVLEADGWKDGK